MTAECQPSQNPAEQKWFSWADTPAQLPRCHALLLRVVRVAGAGPAWACLMSSGANQGTSTLWLQGGKQKDPHSNPRDCSTEERILCVSVVVSETLPPPNDPAIVTMGKMLCKRIHRARISPREEVLAWHLHPVCSGQDTVVSTLCASNLNQLTK